MTQRAMRRPIESSLRFYSQHGPYTRIVSATAPVSVLLRTRAFSGEDEPSKCFASESMILGEALEDLCASAESQLVLCAPFVKAHVIEKLLGRWRGGPTLTVFTRWRVEEVASGV